MGWSGSLTAESAAGSAITYTPDTTAQGAYTVSAFTAPKKGVYCFLLKGSGGTVHHLDGGMFVIASGGAGGTTTGHLLLEAGQTVYIGAGGTCCAAFVSRVNAASLAATGSKENLYFVAGAGGEGGGNWGPDWNLVAYPGASGGGTTGASSSSSSGGTQTAGGVDGQGNRAGSYGVGGEGGYGNDGTYSLWAGRGGDGLYGGGGGYYRYGGGGGSGYIHTSSIQVGSKTYTNETAQGGGAGSDSVGSVTVTYLSDSELPVTFDGVKVMEIIFNGTKVEHLVYNGAAVFIHRIKRRAAVLAEQMMTWLRGPAALREAYV